MIKKIISSRCSK